MYKGDMGCGIDSLGNDLHTLCLLIGERLLDHVFG